MRVFKSIGLAAILVPTAEPVRFLCRPAQFCARTSVSPARMARISRHHSSIGARRRVPLPPAHHDWRRAMSEKPPADRTFTAPADADAAHGRGTVSRRADEAHRRVAAEPSLVSAAALSGLRAAGRDPQRAAREEPPRHRGAAVRETVVPPPADLDPAIRDARTTDGTSNDLQYPRMGAVGCRFGRNVPLAAHGARHRQPARAQPADGQPRADDTRTVPAGDDPQPARGGVDSVHGPRLVRAQALEDRLHRHPDRAWRRLGRARSACRARCPTRRRPVRPVRRRTPTSTATGGTRRRSTAAIATWRPSCAPRPTASCASNRPGCCRSIPSPACTSPASPTTGGSAWRCCTRSSRSSTTTSAICSRTRIRNGPTSSSSARRS